MLSGQDPLEWRVRKRWLCSRLPSPVQAPALGFCVRRAAAAAASSRGRPTPDAVWPVRCPPLTSPRGRRRSGAGRGWRAGSRAGRRARPGLGVGAGSPAGGGGRGRAWSHGGGVTGGGSGRPTGKGGGRGGGSAEPAPAGEQRRLRGPGPRLSELRREAAAGPVFRRPPEFVVIVAAAAATAPAAISSSSSGAVASSSSSSSWAGPIPSPLPPPPGLGPRCLVPSRSRSCRRRRRLLIHPRAP
ncbi:unnamed protein product [Rangifer tarandus platyrhynchus]|uniref:Uncharacterized protein n=1 Tax=Rangifer tarandus platyrhynchus TaxID=3082113 RepID=A0AC59ZTI9_RANTA